MTRRYSNTLCITWTLIIPTMIVMELVSPMMMIIIIIIIIHLMINMITMIIGTLIALVTSTITL
jgi:hypothetical protein